MVNYDNFYPAPDLADAYVAAACVLAEHHYESVHRYTTSAFMRLKLHGQLTERGLAPPHLRKPSRSTPSADNADSESGHTRRRVSEFANQVERVAVYRSLQVGTGPSSPQRASSAAASRRLEPRHASHVRHRSHYAFEGTETIQTLLVGRHFTGSSAFT